MAYPTLTDKPGAIETATAIRRAEMTPLEAVEAAIARIEHLDAHINAVVVTDFDRARPRPRDDRRGPQSDQPLFGVPMTIKESFDVEGLPTCWGHEGACRKHRAARCTRGRAQSAAGAVIVGKTNVPPDLADWQSNNPVYGRTNNPHDHAHSPGGSSGGSAAAVASGMVPVRIRYRHRRFGQGTRAFLRYLGAQGDLGPHLQAGSRSSSAGGTRRA